MTRDQAYEILTKYMKGEHYITHSLAVEAIMRGLAKRLAPDDVEYWGIAGLLHDLDEEQCDWQHDLSVHGPTSVEILKKEGIDDPILFGAICAHNPKSGVKARTKIQYALLAADPMSGFRHITVPMLGGVLTALTDETIQLYSPGRSSQVTDLSPLP